MKKYAFLKGTETLSRESLKRVSGGTKVFAAASCIDIPFCFGDAACGDGCYCVRKANRCWPKG
ncbi:hypothetical protein KTO58_12215 [Chitinophaga pendula]|uniref:hypothetical protein n=1 Tax=Chitinophaga TaxID=79328 RepID=UPI0012FE18F9|nr:MULTISPECIES: hypothetical protein [Chitinophaga]UCJ09925.1 hypothetical protein KTO58_12215 [Chitinophaga pendula]